MGEEEKDWIEGKKILYFTQRSGTGNWRIFEINKTEGRISLVTNDGTWLAEKRINHSLDLRIDNENHMRGIASYLLIELTRTYRGIV